MKNLDMVFGPLFMLAILIAVVLITCSAFERQAKDETTWSGRKLITVDCTEEGQQWTMHQLEYGTTESGLIVTRRWKSK